MSPIKLLLIVHVLLGSIGLLVGSIIIFLKKGDAVHRKLGKVFSYAMLLSGVSALVLATIHPNQFLFAIGIFTIYLIGTGHRLIYLRLLGDTTAKPSWVDWTLSLLMLTFGALLVCYGSYNLVSSGNLFSIALVFFGLIGLSGVWQDYKYYKGIEKSKMYWLKTHIARMTGGYIAASTAFLVNNVELLPSIPSLFYWLLPTVLLVPLIIKWQRKYVVKRS
jgi:uncharacterized membrane protein